MSGIGRRRVRGVVVKLTIHESVGVYPTVAEVLPRVRYEDGKHGLEDGNYNVVDLGKDELGCRESSCGCATSNLSGYIHR